MIRTKKEVAEFRKKAKSDAELLAWLQDEMAELKVTIEENVAEDLVVLDKDLNHVYGLKEVAEMHGLSIATVHRIARKRGLFRNHPYSSIIKMLVERDENGIYAHPMQNIANKYHKSIEELNEISSNNKLGRVYIDLFAIAM